MLDRILNLLWTAVTVGLIVATGSAAIFLVYGGLLELIQGRWEGAIVPVVLGTGLGVGVSVLSWHREDVIGRELPLRLKLR